LGPEDSHTYGTACWLDEEGNRYAVASAIVGESLLLLTKTVLQKPAWEVDVDKATQAQKSLKFNQKASKNSLTIIVKDDVEAAIALLGVVREEGKE
jgi:hypothetical protein